MLRIKTILLSVFILLIAAQGAYGQAEPCRANVDHLVAGREFINAGDYEAAYAAFTCVLDVDPMNLEAYRGRIEASLLANTFSAAVDDYIRLRAQIIPLREDAYEVLFAAYEAELAADPADRVLLTGYAGLIWWVSTGEIPFEGFDRLLELEPNNVYALTFRGSAQFFNGDDTSGALDFRHALELDPENPNIYYMMADAYIYALGDPEQALGLALTASDLGLESARLDAIIASAYEMLGDEEIASYFYLRHVEVATVELIEGEPLAAGQSVTLAILPGQTYALPLIVGADGALDITTLGSPDYVDTFVVLLSPDGVAIKGNDDYEDLNAGFSVPVEEGVYTLLLTTYGASWAGEITVTRG